MTDPSTTPGGGSAEPTTGDVPAEGLGLCGWCGEPAVDQVIVVPGRKNRKLAPVCAAHQKKFLKAGQRTLESEVDRKLEAERKRKTWKGRQQWR